MVNKWIGIGNLGAAPDVKYTASGAAVCNFSIACTEKWKGKDGQWQEKTEWVKIVAWNKLGEICGEYLAKGKMVYIEGKLQTREWEDKNGGKRYTTEIVAREMKMLGGKSEQNKPAGEENYKSVPITDDKDNFIPF